MSNGSGERTEKATPKKRRDARRKGHVFKSTDLSAAISLLALFGVLKVSSTHIGENTQNIFKKYLNPDFDIDFAFSTNAANVFLDVVFSFFLICAPIFVFALLTGVLINYIQVGFLFTSEPLQIKLDRLNPIEGFKRLFSVRALVELIKSVAKIIVIGIVVYNAISDNIKDISGFIVPDLASCWSLFVDIAMKTAFKCGIALSVLAVCDYLYQWWRYEKDLRMTKQEVKEEYKMLEGNPLIKSKIRQKQRQISMRRMMQDVPKADVVVTNPTHYAVALKYDPQLGSAPVVLAKGKDRIAQKIKEIAKENNIELVENKPLAQALYVYCEVGEQIPVDLYKAVAQVLAYVYKLKSQR